MFLPHSGKGIAEKSVDDCDVDYRCWTAMSEAKLSCFDIHLAIFRYGDFD